MTSWRARSPNHVAHLQKVSSPFSFGLERPSMGWILAASAPRSLMIYVVRVCQGLRLNARVSRCVCFLRMHGGHRTLAQNQPTNIVSKHIESVATSRVCLRTVANMVDDGSTGRCSMPLSLQIWLSGRIWFWPAVSSVAPPPPTWWASEWSSVRPCARRFVLIVQTTRSEGDC